MAASIAAPAAARGGLTMLLFEAEGLGHTYPGTPLFQNLSLAIGPGLTLLIGGDGCGKTTLLRLIAGSLVPAAGTVRQRTTPVWHENPADPAHDAVPARAWLQARLPAGAADTPDARSLATAFALDEHLDKPLYMLSTGSRRKLGLVGAAFSAAPLVLLETPFAALDAASSRALSGLLSRAAQDRQRGWIVADYQALPGVDPAALAGLIDLGDAPGGPATVRSGARP